MGLSYGSSFVSYSHMISSSSSSRTNQLTFLSAQSQQPPPPPPSGQPPNNNNNLQPPPPTTPSQYPSLSSSTSSSSSEKLKPLVESVKPESRQKPSKRSGSDSTDWIASSLTRRFGLGAGLAWVGFLAIGVVSEQIKTRVEVSQEKASTREVDQEKEVQLPNGISYYDMRVGGGATPRQGDLVVIGLRGTVVETGQVFVDTFDKNDNRKPLVLVMGSRPYTRGMCEGVEYVLKSMKAGGKRRVIVPPNLGFKEEGADFGGDNGGQVPPNATLEYVVEVERVSIAPA